MKNLTGTGKLSASKIVGLATPQIIPQDRLTSGKPTPVSFEKECLCDECPCPGVRSQCLCYVCGNCNKRCWTR